MATVTCKLYSRTNGRAPHDHIDHMHTLRVRGKREASTLLEKRDVQSLLQAWWNIACKYPRINSMAATHIDHLSILLECSLLEFTPENALVKEEDVNTKTTIKSSGGSPHGLSAEAEKLRCKRCW